MGSRHTKVNSTSQLTKGDVVFFGRPCLRHYGVYVGNGEVVHFSGNKKPNAVIKKENIWKVANGCNIWIENRSGYRSPLSRDEIVRRALALQGKKGYDLWWSNCEHFANWCRYGMWESRQVHKAAVGIWTVICILNPFMVIPASFALKDIPLK